MCISNVFRLLSVFFLFIWLATGCVNVQGQTKPVDKKDKGKPSKEEKPSPANTKQDTKAGAEKPASKEINKPDIKEVPKSRKQVKPTAVKPKVKPIKIVRPKIKKP